MSETMNAFEPSARSEAILSESLEAEREYRLATLRVKLRRE